MLANTVVMVLMVSAACAQLDQGILAALYYPPVASEQHPKVPHKVTAKKARSSFVRQRGFFDHYHETNNDVMARVLAMMADPNWLPVVIPRHHSADIARHHRQHSAERAN